MKTCHECAMFPKYYRPTWLLCPLYDHLLLAQDGQFYPGGPCDGPLDQEQADWMQEVMHDSAKLAEEHPLPEEDATSQTEFMNQLLADIRASRIQRNQ